MEVTPSLPKAALAVIAVVVVLFLAALGWIGGELHYGNCLEKAEVEGQTVAHCSRWP
jgi:VIT1/CCC1 family predicted Fe2+/Mn2+ transporter